MYVHLKFPSIRACLDGLVPSMCWLDSFAWNKHMRSAVSSAARNPTGVLVGGDHHTSKLHRVCQLLNDLDPFVYIRGSAI
jgi:hypothetical protein